MAEPTTTEGLPIEVYHHGTPGISASGLIQMGRSPAHYRFWKDNPKEPTDAMIRGSAIHSAILEPELFKSEYTVCDDLEICEQIGGARPRSTNAYKAWREAWDEEHAGQKILTLETFRSATRIADKAHAHPAVEAMLSETAKIEESMRWEDEATGITLKIRPDLRLLSGRLVDVKTCVDARPDSFQRSIYNFGYHIQAAVYREGVKRVLGQKDVPFRFVVIEADEPHAIAVYDLDEFSMELGHAEFRRCLDLYAECKRTNNWPDYPTDIIEISLPAWAARG